MSRTDILVFALVSFLVLAWSSAARSAGDPTRGNTLYQSTYHCANCHEAAPSPAVVAGGTVAGILNAIATCCGMGQ